MNGRGRQMFELTIIQKRGKEVNSIKLYFENAGRLFEAVHMAIANSKHETEYAIRVLEEGEVVE